MKLFSTALPYLLLVTFYSGELNDFGLEKIAAVNGSVYQGVAVPLAGAYDPVTFSRKDLDAAVVRLKSHSRKHIWPWVYFNRFVGYKEGGRTLSPLAAADHFRVIKGMDLYDEAGALQEFYDLWRMSLRLARELGSPGIVVDAETYNNNRDAYRLEFLAAETGRSAEEIKGRLKEIGKKLADLAHEDYPEAVLWFLFTDLPGQPADRRNPSGERAYRTVTYIVQGMLERAKETRSKLKLVSGGEFTLGYCHPSLEELQKKIGERQRSFAPFLSRYPNLALGGTLAPWHDAAQKKAGYFSNGRCNNTLQGLADFKPLVSELSRSYGYVWIYAASAAGYNPYDRAVAAEYNTMLGSAVAGK